MKRFLKVMAVSVAAAPLLAACGETEASDSEERESQVDFLLNFAVGGFHAGFAVAQEQGYYSDSGLDVDIQEGTGSTTTAQLIASRQADIGYADSAAIMQLIDQGAPLKVIATVSQVGSSQVTALSDSDFSEIEDLQGRSVGVPQGSAQVPLVPLLLEANGLTEEDVDIVNLPSTSMVPSLLQGQVDTILGSTDFYGIQLEEQGAETTDLLFSDVGIPIQGVSIFAAEDWLETNDEAAKDFVAASLQGWSDAMDDEAAALEDLSAAFPEIDPEQASVELAVTPQLFCENDANVFGKSEPEAWETSYELLTEAGLLEPDQDPTTFYTYDYLPAEDEMRSCTS